MWNIARKTYITKSFAKRNIKSKLILKFKFGNIHNELVELTTKNSSLEFYTCFVENGVILLPRSSHRFRTERTELIRKVQEKISILKERDQ